MARVLRLVLLCVLAGCGRSPVDVWGVELVDELDRDEPDPVEAGCPKVDYLFVIDNSASMGDNQQKLVDSFGVFIEGVRDSQARLESVHVGVVTTDAYQASPEGCHALGGLVTQTGGYNSSDARCGPYAEGHNYMTERDDLQATFPCAAQVGTTGDTEERPLEALTSAAGEMRGPGECNEGFIRDDALLVAVIVTDEDDPRAIEHRYEQLLDAKDGHADNIVMVGLINEPGTECSLSGHAVEAPGLAQFLGMFEHSFIGPVCGDYSVAFSRAIAVVEAACA